MRLLKLCIVIITSIHFCEIKAQKKENKFSISYIFTSFDKSQGDFLMGGVEFEYMRKLNNRFSISGNIQFDRHNSFPKFSNGGINTGLNPNIDLVNYINKNIRSVGELWTKINQTIYSINLNYSSLKIENHDLYFSSGVGLNIQDALTYGIESVRIKIYENGTSDLLSYTDYYSQRSSNTLIIQFGIGYDYKIYENWLIGTNLRIQLPIKRDEYFFKHGGFGFDETIRLGIKISKTW